MPVYEYVCEKCGYKFEKVLVAVGRHRSVVCPECNNLGKKVPSIFRFSIKGAR